MNTLAPSTLLQSVTRGGQPLPAALRFKLEAIFKADFSCVRIHIGPEAAALGANAFAQGQDIGFAPDRYAPTTREGAALLAHELAHVIQQGQGRVPVPTAKSPVIEDAGLEAEADAAAAYCAARLFPVPGHRSDAAMPDDLMGASGAEHGYERRPIQCQRTSAQSYGDFKTSCYTYLSGYNGTAIGAIDHQARMNHIYGNIYSAYNHYGVGPKVALAGNPLYQEMINFIDATNSVHGSDNRIRIQTGAWPPLNGDVAKAAITTEYQNVINATILPAALTANAAAATNHYLHVYPNPVRVVVSNWRIGINVPPGEIAAALTALIPVMQGNADINHIKFAAPTMVGKPDSVIVYMRKNAATYGPILAAVRAAVPAPAFHIVHQFAPMWNELAPGVAVAAEPPNHGGSFGVFRCVIAYQAYLLMRRQYCSWRWNAENYGTVCDALFTHFGIPAPVNPHEQNALAQPFANVRAAIFMGLNNIYDGRTLINR